MSHIPAAALPHAAPKHHDKDSQPHGEAMTMEPTATAADTAPIAPPPPAATILPAAAGEPAPSPVGTVTPVPVAATAAPAQYPASPSATRSGWVVPALLAGGAALVAGIVAVGVPMVRRSDDAEAGKRERKA